MNLISKEYNIIQKTYKQDNLGVVPSFHSKQSRSSLTAQGVTGMSLQYCITTLYLPYIYLQVLTAAKVIQGVCPRMYLNLTINNLLSFPLYLNTSIPPPSIQVFPYLLRVQWYIPKLRGVPRSISYNGLTAPLQFKNHTSSWGHGLLR